MKLIYCRIIVPFLFSCLVLGLVGCVQRRLLYFPTHHDCTQVATDIGLIKWEIEGEYTGYARVVNSPRRVWFFTHGNGGQAGNRANVVEHVGAGDSIYIQEPSTRLDHGAFCQTVDFKNPHLIRFVYTELSA